MVYYRKEKVRSGALKDIWIVLTVLGGIVLVVLATKLAIFLVEWKQGLDYINMELARSDGEERTHWEHEKRRHWRRIFPFLKKVEGDDRRKKEQKSLYRTAGSSSRHSGSHHHSSQSGHHRGSSGGSGSHPHVTRHPKMK